MSAAEHLDPSALSAITMANQYLCPWQTSGQNYECRHYSSNANYGECESHQLADISTGKYISPSSLELSSPISPNESHYQNYDNIGIQQSSNQQLAFRTSNGICEDQTMYDGSNKHYAQQQPLCDLSSQLLYNQSSGGVASGISYNSNATASSFSDVCDERAILSDETGGENFLNSYQGSDVFKGIQYGHHASGEYGFSQYRIQQDSNPKVIHKCFPHNPMLFTQRIHVRYLQPPPLPAPGPLIIKEIRASQLPPPPPLVIKQKPPPPKICRPIVLREKPPKPPHVPGPQVITKNLPPLPPPPRQLIIERYPPIPPKPGDIFVERWLPYQKPPKRKVIYKRDISARAYKANKNIIICYEFKNPRIRRELIRQGVIMMNPYEYEQRYGATLLNSYLLNQQLQRYRIADLVQTSSHAAIKHVEDEEYVEHINHLPIRSGLSGIDNVTAYGVDESCEQHGFIGGGSYEQYEYRSSGVGGTSDTECDYFGSGVGVKGIEGCVPQETKVTSTVSAHEDLGCHC
ncbi:hypothetical protein GJ496_003902 [Pomphorhynchus laevis]|nr:hypothetical protein GJ496_003902 [Pomphorhynchus laevis]